MTGWPAYWLSETCLPGSPRAASVNAGAARLLAAPPLPVVTLTAITMAVNTTATVEITLCRPVSRTVHRAAPGTLSMLITFASAFAFTPALSGTKALSSEDCGVRP